MEICPAQGDTIFSKDGRYLALHKRKQSWDSRKQKSNLQDVQNCKKTPGELGIVSQQPDSPNLYTSFQNIENEEKQSINFLPYAPCQVSNPQPR